MVERFFKSLWSSGLEEKETKKVQPSHTFKEILLATSVRPDMAMGDADSVVVKRIDLSQ